MTLRAQLSELGELVVGQRWADLGQRMSPWLSGRQDARDELATFIDEMRAEWDLPDDAWPSAADIDTNPLGPDELRGFYPDKLDPDIDDDNFLGYGCLQLLASEDEPHDAYADVWVALYTRDGASVVGLWHVDYPD